MRSLLIAILLLVACARPIPMPEPLVMVRYDAPAIYTQWYQEVLACVRYVNTTVSDFTIDSSAAEAGIAALRFFAVPSEKNGGVFDLAIGPVYGAQMHGFLLLSGQHLNDRVVVKHEIMHTFVLSPGEDILGAHGAPWGLCEWL